MIKYLDNSGLDYLVGGLKSINDNRYHEMNIGHSVLPIYMGDFVTEGLIPNSCVKVGNFIYIIGTYNDNTNMGKVIVYNVSTNKEVTAYETEIEIGHANSICYYPDSSEFFIAPAYTLDSDNIVNTDYVLIYDNSFTLIDKVYLPEAVHSVAFDNVTNELYAYNTNGNVYRWSSANRIFELYVNIGSDLSAYNQGFAVYDDKFYISSPYGYCLFGKFTGMTSAILGGFTVTAFDKNMRFDMRELEDWNFTTDGHLICVKYSRVASSIYCGFVCELNIGTANPYTSTYGNTFVRGQNTYEITSETESNFYNNDYQLKTINQINCCLNEQFSQININSDHEEGVLYVRRNLKLNVNAEVTIDNIQLMQGTLNINTSNGNLVFTTSGTPIINSVNGEVIISGTACNVEFENLESPVAMVSTSSSGCFTSYRVVPADITLTHHGTVVTANNVFFGGVRISGS